MKPDTWSAADDATLRQFYDTETPMEVLAEKLGRTVRGVYRRAYLLDIQRRRLQTIQIEELNRRILVLATRTNGVSSDEVDGIQVSKQLGRLTDRGLLHRGKLGHKTVRYFASRPAAEAYVSKYLGAFLAAAAKRAPKEKRGNRWAADLPMVITPATKFTYAPPPPAMVYRTNTHSPL